MATKHANMQTRTHTKKPTYRRKRHNRCTRQRRRPSDRNGIQFAMYAKNSLLLKITVSKVEN